MLTLINIISYNYIELERLEILLNPTEHHSALESLGPLDGRYSEKTSRLRRFFSEAALINYRLKVESSWLLFLSAKKLAPDVTPWAARLNHWVQLKDKEAAAAVKTLEKTTNHDVKAVEYYMQQELRKAGAPDSALAWIHFACTSEDINNTAYALMCRDAVNDLILPEIENIQKKTLDFAKTFANQPMLARTHGQTASPTTLGKEFSVFWHRIDKCVQALQGHRHEAKMNGAVGNFNAHLAAFPKVDWAQYSKEFITKDLKLSWNSLTTQIENHDSVVRLMNEIAHANTIWLGLCRDLWSYISIGYFKQKTVATEIGSSTMPHKVNPIDFENAEGNFGLANALADHFRNKLLISRWQRDLSDSTVLRSIGTFFGHSVLAYQSLMKGLNKLEVDRDALNQDLDQAWEVLGEAVQTLLRKHGVLDAYERLKAATRGQKVTKEILQQVIRDAKEIPETERKELLQLTPAQYVGLAETLARKCEELRKM